MIRMTKNGAFMDCYTQQEADRAKSKGWEVVVPPKKKAARKAKK